MEISNFILVLIGDVDAFKCRFDLSVAFYTCLATQPTQNSAFYANSTAPEGPKDEVFSIQFMAEV